MTNLWFHVLLRIGQIPGNTLLIEQGALYPGLVRQGVKFDFTAGWNFVSVS